MLLASLGTSIANIALPTLAGAFAVPFAQMQAVVVAYLAALTVSVFVAGSLGDRYGLKPMLILGLALFSSGALLCGLAPNLELLIGARVLQGAGAAFLMTLSMALVRQTVGETRLGRAMGLLGTMSALGTALGPSLGGLLIPVAGWRSIFLVQVPLALIALLLVLIGPKVGARKREIGEPALHRPLAFNRGLLPHLVVNLLVAAVMMTTLLVGPLYLGTGLGLTEMQVGLVMSVGPMISIFAGVPSGRLVDAWGSRRVMGFGLGLLATGAGLLSFLPGWIGVAGYVLAIVVLTPGYQLFQAANNTATLTGIPESQRGRVSGLLGLSRNLGLIVGASAMGTVFALGADTTDLTHAGPSAMTGGMCFTFGLAGASMLVALAIEFGGSLRKARR
ncbi:MAG: MFS transporter [Pseudacidovorax sp.]|nr:MFS transporter [Pseudacidovorax sp.]